MPQTAFPPPRSLNILGWLNFLFGVLIPLANGILVWFGIVKLRNLGLSAGTIAPLWWVIAAYGVAGLVLVLAGVGLCRPALWGRRLALVGAGLLFVTVFVALVGVNVAWDRAKLEYQGPPVGISIWAGVPGLWPAYGVVLLVLLHLPSVRNWVRAEKARKRGLAPDPVLAGTGGPPVSTLAVVTLVLALTPLAGLTQAAALVTGLLALRKVRRSRGALTGVGLALAGLVFAALILAGVVALFLFTGGGTLFTSMPLTALGGLIALGLVPFLVGNGR